MNQRILVGLTLILGCAVHAAGQERQGKDEKDPAKAARIPLTEMGPRDRYKGEDGGLYGGGKNEPPEAHRKAAAKETAKITPLDGAGKPASDGKVVLVSISMS